MWKSSGGNFPRVIIRTRWRGAVKCRDGNCREDGASAGKNVSREGHEGSRGTSSVCQLSSCDFVSLVVMRFKLPLAYRLRFGRTAWGDLYLRFALTLSKESGASYFAQAYIPTQPAQAIEDTRISRAHEDPGRQESNFPPARQGAQAGLGKTRFPRIVQRRGEKPRPPAVMPDILRHPVALVTWK